MFQILIQQNDYNQTLINYIAWLLISVSYGAAAFGVFRLSFFLGDILKVGLYVIGSIGAAHGTLGILNAGIGLFYLVVFKMDVRLEWLANVRLAQNLIFAVMVATVVNWSVYRCQQLAPVQVATVKEAARAFGRLRTVLEHPR